MKNTLIAAVFGLAAASVQNSAVLLGVLGFLVVFQALTLLELQRHYHRILMLLQINRRIDPERFRLNVDEKAPGDLTRRERPHEEERDAREG